MKKLTPFAGILVVIAIFVISGAVFIVEETKQVLVLQFGEPVQQISEPGLHFKIPFIQSVRVFEERILNVDPDPNEALLKDKKRIVVDAFARYRIVDMIANYEAVSSENESIDRLSRVINSAMRNVLGNAGLQQLLSEERTVLMKQIQEMVNSDAAQFGIEIVDVRIVRADLPEQVTQSTFSRMRSEREQEAALARSEGAEIAREIKAQAEKEQTILLADAERQSETLRGQGDQQAIDIYAEAFERDPDFYEFYRSLEAYRKSLANSDKTLILSPESDFFKHLRER